MDHAFYFDFASPVILKEKLQEVEIGEVTTLEAAEEARVATRADGDTVLLDFALPRGKEGFSTTAAVEEASLTLQESAFTLNPNCIKVTVCDRDGEKTFDVPPSGLYDHPMVSKQVFDNHLTLRANTHYCHFPLNSTNGYLKVDLSSENSFNSLSTAVRFVDTWRLLFSTHKVGTSGYVEAIHLPADVCVPSDWIGQSSSRFLGYNEYYLTEDTTYEITVEKSGNHTSKFLSCKTWSS